MSDSTWEHLIKAFVALVSLGFGAGGLKLFQAWRRSRREDEESTIKQWRDIVYDLRADYKTTVEGLNKKIKLLEEKVSEGQERERKLVRANIRYQIGYDKCQPPSSDTTS